MRHFLNRPRVADKKSGGLYTYHQGMEYHADAMEMVFNSPFTNPLQMVTGTGVDAGQFRPLQPPQVIYRHTVLTVGIPTIIGGITMQPLLGDSSD